MLVESEATGKGRFCFCKVSAFGGALGDYCPVLIAFVGLRALLNFVCVCA